MPVMLSLRPDVALRANCRLGGPLCRLFDMGRGGRLGESGWASLAGMPRKTRGSWICGSTLVSRLHPSVDRSVFHTGKVIRDGWERNCNQGYDNRHLTCGCT